MIQYFINRGGKGLSAKRKKKLEMAKRILQERVARQKKAGPRERRKGQAKRGAST